MKTAKYIKTLLEKMWDKEGMSQEMEPQIKEIMDAVTERDTHLQNSAKEWHTEDAEEFDFVAKDPVLVLDDWEAKYNDMKQRYKDAFFSGGIPNEPNIEPPEAKEEVTTLEDLLTTDEE